MFKRKHRLSFTYCSELILWLLDKAINRSIKFPALHQIETIKKGSFFFMPDAQFANIISQNVYMYREKQLKFRNAINIPAPRFIRASAMKFWNVVYCLERLEQPINALDIALVIFTLQHRVIHAPVIHRGLQIAIRCLWRTSKTFVLSRKAFLFNLTTIFHYLSWRVYFRAETCRILANRSSAVCFTLA